MKAIINDKTMKLHIYVTIYNYVACEQLSRTCLFGLHLPVSKLKGYLGFTFMYYLSYFD